MKIHIMTDLEGCAGVVEAHDYIHRESKYYEYACELATLETSAAVEGALDGGATEVLVVDGHGPGAMKRHLLHPRAKLLTGRPWPNAYPFGCDGSFTAGMIIGQHAMSNTDGGHLCHTMSFGVEAYVLNDKPIGELGLWMLTAGYFGVPVVMVSGDQAASDEARGLVPNIEVAPVKSGVSRGTAKGLAAKENSTFNSVAVHLHPNEARALIRERAYYGVRRIPEFAPLRMDPPYTLTIAMRPEKGKKRSKETAMRSKDLLDLVSGRGKRVRLPAPSRKKGGKPAADKPSRKGGRSTSAKKRGKKR